MENRQDTTSSFPGSADRPVLPDETSRALSAKSQSYLNAPHASQSNLEWQRVISNEQSPLLSAQDTDRHDSGPEIEERLIQALDCKDEGVRESLSSWYLFILTLGIGGLQIAWATEMSNGSPYLLSLGISKALLAFVWIAGPLTGVLVQPYIGILSDNSRISWGKRRPFMLFGTLGTGVSLLALAWTRELVGGFLGLFGADPDSTGVHNAGIVFAVVWVYVVDFSVNTVQAALRAFIVDCAPTHQQETANAWAGCMSGFGNILGYLFGYIDLPRVLPIFGNTQFKVLCAIATIALATTVATSSLLIKERDPRLEGPPEGSKLGVLSFFKSAVKSFKRLPPQIRVVCEVQFFNWIGWFPFLFYITTYVGQLHVNPILEKKPHLTPEELDKIWERATRVGTFALLIFAIISFVSNMLLPFIVAPTYKSPTNRQPSRAARTTRILTLLQIPWLNIRRAWLLAHVLFAACMASTFFITTPTAATVMVGVVGVSWSMTLWAPFALVSAEISQRDAPKHDKAARRSSHGADDAASIATTLRDEDVEDQAGVILGLHNVAISSPQILAALVSSAIFKIAQRDRGVAGDGSVGWVLRFGGIAALLAAWMTSRFGEKDKELQLRASEHS